MSHIANDIYKETMYENWQIAFSQQDQPLCAALIKEMQLRGFSEIAEDWSTELYEAAWSCNECGGTDTECIFCSALDPDVYHKELALA